MKVQLLTLLFCAQSLSFIEASSTLSLPNSPAKKMVKVSELTPENFYQELLKCEQMEPFAAFFNPEANSERALAVISFMKEQLDEHTDLSGVRFFEIFKQLFQDPTVNSRAFREFVTHLQSNEKTAGIMLVHEVPAKQPAFHTPSSLKNHGNTCFLNSMIQALLPLIKNSFSQTDAKDTNATRRLFLRFLHARNLNNNGNGEKELERFVRHIWKTLFPDQKARQQDAYNFLNGLLMNLAPVEYLDIDQQAPDFDMAQHVPDLGDIFDPNFLNFEEEDLLQQESHAVANRLAIKQQSVKTVPTHPRENSSTDEILSNLDLPLNGSKKLEEAIHTYFKPETLDDYKVDGKVTPATKQLRLNQIGNIVILNLKRYHYGAVGTRIATPTEFPLVDLDLAPYFSDATKNPGKYELSAVVMHSGSSLNSGHYIAYVRGDIDGRPTWFYCSDSSVYAIADDEMARIAYRGYGPHAQCLPTTFFYTVSDVTPKPSSENIALFMAAYNKAGNVCIKKLPLSGNVVSSETEKYVVTPLEKLLTQPLHPPVKPTLITTPQAHFSWTDPQVLITATALLIAWGYIHKKEIDAQEKEKKEKKERIRKLLLARAKLPSMAVTPNPTVPPTAA